MHQKAPFNLEQITALQIYQNSVYFHPYTCPNSGDLRKHQYVAPEKLFPIEKGLICLTCEYIQGWAINWTTDLQMVKDAENKMEECISGLL